jgi:hypothetical protein
MTLLSSSNNLRKLLWLLLLSVVPTVIGAQSEADHIRVLGEFFGGRTEQYVDNGKIDILTDTHAIEVEWANKWKNSIGQSLWYGLQTGKSPGIILLVKTPQDRRHLIRLQTTIDHNGLGDQIRVWAYPEDFPGLTVAPPPIAPNDDPSLTHWLNLSSKKRHNSSCEKNYGRTKNGRYCRADEGEACGICGG